MNFKKFSTSDNQWHDVPYYVRKTDTDTLTLPQTIYGDGTNATFTLKGNTTQSGTPSPQNPVDVTGVGDLETSGEHAGQYKIPILNGSTTTPVYLGQVESTRQIKKYEITGLEDWTVRAGTPENEFFCERQDVNFINNAAICSHYSNQDSGSFADLQDKHFLVRVGSSGDKTYFGIRDSSYPSNNEGAAQLKGYLRQQYANGTPVTVWYVLETPTTGIVNEPLMKIGDYADSLTTSIPTTDGANALSVDTQVQPSEVTANYHGWHPVQSAHERDSGQWD